MIPDSTLYKSMVQSLVQLFEWRKGKDQQSDGERGRINHQMNQWPREIVATVNFFVAIKNKNLFGKSTK